MDYLCLIFVATSYFHSFLLIVCVVLFGWLIVDLFFFLSMFPRVAEFALFRRTCGTTSVGVSALMIIVKRWVI